LRFIRLPSQIALPNLLNENIKIDFGFIDGNHKFDNIFIDWFYIDLLLNNNGYVLFDDTWLESTQKTISFIKNNREDYKEIAIPTTNMGMFQKIDGDKRTWSHFKPF